MGEDTVQYLSDCLWKTGGKGGGLFGDSKCEESMHLGVILGVVLGQQLWMGFTHSQLHV